MKLDEWLWSLWAEGRAVDNGLIVIHGKCPGSSRRGRTVHKSTASRFKPRF